MVFLPQLNWIPILNRSNSIIHLYIREFVLKFYYNLNIMFVTQLILLYCLEYIPKYYSNLGLNTLKNLVRKSLQE